MPISRARKEELVAQIVTLLEESNGFAVVQSTGMTVPQVEALRNEIRQAGGQYVVVKNTLLRIALEQAGWTIPYELLSGRSAVAFGRDNFPGVAKAVLSYIDDKDLDEKMQVKGGMMIGDILDAKQVEAVSKLPSLDELRSQLAGLIVQPATGLVTVLEAATGQVVNVLAAYVRENEGGSEGDAA